MTTPTKYVYVDGVFDMFHKGHVNMLKRAKDVANERGCLLLVGVLTDADVATYKRTPVLTMEERVDVVSACRFVDKVIAAPPIVPHAAFMKQESIEYIVHGDDFDQATLMKYYGDAVNANKFIHFPYTQGISTSQLIKRIQKRLQEGTL